MVIELKNQSLDFIPNEIPLTYSKVDQIEWYKRYGYLLSERKKEYVLSNGLKIKNRKQFIKRTYKFDKVLAYDTETYKGTCKLIARNEGRIKHILNPTFDDCIHFLFYLADNPNTYRFFFNIDFDISAILKLWNNIEQIEHLKNGITIFYKEFSLKWIKGRMFIIKHIKRKKSVIFTDIFNFFRIGLNEIAEKYLKDKVKDKIDGNLLNTSLDYWKNNEKSIINYCINDCILTRDIGKLLIDTIIKCKLPLPRYLVSSASLSKQYFRLNSYIPNISCVPEIIQQIAYDSYFGGRFEMFKRGFFNSLYLYDIVSQYPYFIRNLPNLRDGMWKKTMTIPKEQCLGYFLVKIEIPYDYKIPTIPIHHNGVNKFPVGTMNKWLTWFDIDLIREYIVEVYDGYVFFPTHRNFKPFVKEIDFLFENKSRVKGNSEIEYNLYKLCMNALYGCFIESHKNYDIDGNYELNAGIMFNSVYASQITAFGRWSVIKDIPKENYDNIIAIHTDSIISNIPLDDFLIIGKELGQWNLEKEGKGIVLNTGMYQISNMVKTRGIPKKFIGNWLRFCLKNEIYKRKTFLIPHMRKLSEGLVRDKSLINVNTIINEKKSVNCNSDSKRDWLYRFRSFQEVLDTQIDSYPYIMYDNSLNLHPNLICVDYRYILNNEL